jgi:hypothetical protein
MKADELIHQSLDGASMGMPFIDYLASRLMPSVFESLSGSIQIDADSNDVLRVTEVSGVTVEDFRRIVAEESYGIAKAMCEESEKVRICMAAVEKRG